LILQAWSEGMAFGYLGFATRTMFLYSPVHSVKSDGTAKRLFVPINQL